MDEGDADVDTAALYAQVVVDRAELTRNIRQELQGRSQISLAEVMTRHGGALPAWLTFDPATGALTGTPPADKNCESFFEEY